MTNNVGGHSGALYTRDLSVGQKLVRVERGGFRNDMSAMDRYTITKITKTRLILNMGGVGGVTLRVLVEGDSRYGDAGRVKTRAEGDGDYARGVFLYTLDDPGLVDILGKMAEKRVRRDTLEALETLARAVHQNVETLKQVEAAADAIATLRKNLS